LIWDIAEEKNMNTYRYDIKNGNVEIPAIMIEPAAPKGAAVVIHGYGGCKEEQLGMAWRIAEKGLAYVR
jgi:dienelactone hydrolase